MASVDDPDSGFPPEEDARRQAYHLLVRAAAKAADDGDFDRFDGLIDKLLRSGSTVSESDLLRDVSMDRYRVAIAFGLVVSLFGAVTFALVAPVGNGQATAQYISLISGLAGIAIGWLYSGSSPVRRRRDGR